MVPKYVTTDIEFSQCLQQARMLKERYIIEEAAESDRYLARFGSWPGPERASLSIVGSRRAVCVCSQGALAGAKDLLFKYAARPSTRDGVDKVAVLEPS